MATTIQSISPPLHPYHVVSATSCGTVAKTRSLIISSKAKDKPDQAQAQAQDQGQGKINPCPLYCSLGILFGVLCH